MPCFVSALCVTGTQRTQRLCINLALVRSHNGLNTLAIQVVSTTRHEHRSQEAKSSSIMTRLIGVALQTRVQVCLLEACGACTGSLLA